MMRPTALLRAGLMLACATALSGCISLLPKSKPAQLYRFGKAPAAAPPTTGSLAVRPVGVYRANSLFQREASGDRLLAVTGERTQFVAQARWVAPAQVLFDQAVLNAFDASPGPARLVTRGEGIRSAYALRLDVRNFETRYDTGAQAAPTVVVRVRAALIRDRDRSVQAEQIFEARTPAADNRISAIVPAYNQATAQVLGQIVTWTNSQVGGG